MWGASSPSGQQSRTSGRSGGRAEGEEVETESWLGGQQKLVGVREAKRDSAELKWVWGVAKSGAGARLLGQACHGMSEQ